METREGQLQAVEALRTQYLNAPAGPILKRQKQIAQEKPIRGPLWVSRTSFPAPREDEISGEVLKVARQWADDGMAQDLPSTVSPAQLYAEWVGYRPGVGLKATEPDLSDHKKYKAIMKSVESEITILYVHGGAFCVGSPSVVRGVTSRLAARTKGRCLAFKYRLAPQNVFPAALVDVLVAYLSLMYPPAGSFHQPVPASKIILAGDSAGGSLCLSAIQTLRGLSQDQGKRVPSLRFHGKEVAVDMPAGVTTISAFCDLTHSLPSWQANHRYDILKPIQPFYEDSYPHDTAWPASPPRGDVYCNSRLLSHPLVSPAIARDWSGSPPMWFCSGQERGSDGMQIVASSVAQHAEVPVIFELYECMPHIFAMVLPKLPQSDRCYRSWADACRQFVNRDLPPSTANMILMPGKDTQPLDVKHLHQISVSDVETLIKAGARARQPWTGGSKSKAKL